MSYFITRKTKAVFIAFWLLLCLIMTTTAQTIQIDSTFNTDGEIFPFGSTGEVYGLYLSGSITLNSDTSMVRIILVDSSFNEYMVYEAYQYICPSSPFDTTNVCDETCYSNGFTPYSILIQIYDATIQIDSLFLSNNQAQNPTELQTQEKQNIELQKVVDINKDIANYNMLWYADTNAISQLTYQKKKSIFGGKYNMLGMDYYMGGIYDPTPNAVRAIDNSTLIEEWDWRSRHGADDPTKSNYYYDNTIGGKQGWMTKLKNQMSYNCSGLCYIYAPLGAIEAVANLYYNTKDHKDYDLSIQQVLDCDSWPGSTGANECDSGYVEKTNTFIQYYTTGLYKEDSCYVREHMPDDCREDIYDTCTPYQISFDLNAHLGAPGGKPPISVIKTGLIQNGPMCSTLSPYSSAGAHAMVLTGYGKIKVGDTIHLTNGADSIIGPNSPYINNTFWIYKNSWGTHGRDGYFYHVDSPNHPKNSIYYITPIKDSLLEIQESPTVYDLDKDGYHNWGIDDDYQPEGTEKDSDDSEPRLGPFDEDYYSIPIMPVMEVKRGEEAVANNSFYSYYDSTWSQSVLDTLTFTILNTGTAQLNLKDNFVGSTILLSNYDSLVFDLDIDTAEFITAIPKESGSTSFDIIINLEVPLTEPLMATVTIQLEEDDMDNFVFNLVITECNYSVEADTIDRIETWDTNDIKFNDVFVPDGAILTVTSDIAFTSNASLLIEQGGEVIIDGGHLTSLCELLWQGVDVWGDITKSQFHSPPDVSLEQGKITIINNGKISFAENAIETIKYVGEIPDGNTSGGIVIINNGSIENCKMGVVFYPYKNFYPTVNNPRDNWSSFTKTIFSNDLESPVAQVSLNGVDGITIKGCNFINKIPVGGLSSIASRGIYSINSGFRVSEIVLQYPNEGSIKTTFKGFEHGIYSATAGLPLLVRDMSVSNSIFEDNKRGIYLSAIENPVIIKNEFLVREKYSKFSSSTELVGLYLDGLTTGFTVEENKFYTDIHYEYLTGEKCNGITVNNSGEIFNEIYNNSFNNLTVGFAAGGKNRDSIGTGLCVKCNDFKECRTDIYVCPEKDTYGSPILGPTVGIAMKQGKTNTYPDTLSYLAAGNTFSSYDTTNFLNDTNCRFVTYVHHYRSSTSGPWVPIVSTNMINEPDYFARYDKETSCPSNLEQTRSPIIDMSILTNENILIEAYTDTLVMVTDGGDTEQLDLDVVTAFPNQSMQLRQQLLDESPYLSDKVMKSAIDQEYVLPNAMIRDVLSANPQAAKSPDVLQTLDGRNVQMPEYMIAQIMQGQSIIGDKEQVEQELTKHKIIYTKARIIIEKYYQSDTVNPAAAQDSLVALWDSQPYPESKYRLAFHYLKERDSTTLFATLDLIPIEFDLTLNEMDLHDQYEALFDVLWQTNDPVYGIDSTQLQSLMDISENSRTIPGIYALNMLIQDGVVFYDEPVYFPDYFKSVTTYGEWDSTIDKEDFLKVFPNPAGAYFIVEHNLKQYEGVFMIVVTDMLGKAIDSHYLRSEQNQQVISTFDYTSGMYLVQLIVNGVHKETEKLSISK